MSVLTDSREMLHVMLRVCFIAACVGLFAASSHALDAMRPDARRHQGADLAAWHEQIKNIDPKSIAAQAIVPPLVEIVANESLRGVDREPFAAFLARVGAPAAPVVPVLAHFIEQRSVTLDFVWATRALALMGEPAKAATPALVALLLDHQVPVDLRQSSIEALARIGASHEDAIPALLGLLRIRDAADLTVQDAARLRQLGTAAIYVVGPDAYAAAPLLVRMLRDPREPEATRRNAVTALGAIGPEAAFATTALVEELISSPSPSIRDEAAKSLVRIAHPGTLRLLAQLARHPDPEVRWRMVVGLRGSSKIVLAQGASALLSDRLADVDSRVRTAAVETSLEVLGPSEALVAAAIPLLGEENRDIRIRAKRVLQALPPLHAKHLQRIEDLAKEPGRSARVRRDLETVTRQLTRRANP